MEYIEMNQLSEVALYAIGPKEASSAAPLLTTEAVSLIQNAEAFGLALAEEGKTCATVCARLTPDNETVLELISLYVIPEFRRRSLGSTLLIELLERIMETTDASVRFITGTFLADDQAMTSMLLKFGFEITQENEAVSWQIPLGKIPDSVLMKTTAELPSNVSLHSLAELSDYQIRQLVYTLKEHHVDMLSSAQLRQAHQQASYILQDGKGNITACAIFTESGHARITLSQFFSIHKQVSPIVAVLQASAKIILEQFSSETVLEIPTLTRSSGKLVQHLIPDSRPVCLNRAVLDLTRA